MPPREPAVGGERPAALPAAGSQLGRAPDDPGEAEEDAGGAGQDDRPVPERVPVVEPSEIKPVRHRTGPGGEPGEPGYQSERIPAPAAHIDGGSMRVVEPHPVRRELRGVLAIHHVLVALAEQVEPDALRSRAS